MLRSNDRQEPPRGNHDGAEIAPPARTAADAHYSSLRHPSGYRSEGSVVNEALSMTLTESPSRAERAEEGRCKRAVRELSASVAQQPHRIVDAAGAFLAATATVGAATASGGALSLPDILLGVSAAAVTLMSLDYGERVSAERPISVTNPLRNWGEGFVTHLKWLKEAFDEDGAIVCLSAVAMSFCSKLPHAFYPSVGVALGAMRVVCSSTFFAALRCGVGALALPLAATATLSRAIAKPVHDFARWMGN